MPSFQPSPRHTLVSLVVEQAERTPDRTAVLDRDHASSYAGLVEGARRVSGSLVAAGVGKGDIVGVCLTRSTAMIEAVLGVQLAGAAYVPLDPTYPTDRLTLVTEDADPRAMLFDGATRDVVAGLVGSAPACVAVDVAATGADGATMVPVLPGPPEPEDAAYVIYTSGSTGRPKGAILEHRNTVAMLESLQEMLAEVDLTGVLFSTSLSFDLSVFEVFGTLSLGGTIIVAENGLELPEHPHRSRVTLINTVPSVIATLARGNDVPTSVSTVITSGDVCTRAVADAVAGVPSVTRHFNLYGPTECVTWQIGALVDPTSREEPPLGKPFARVEVAAVGPAFVDVEPGQVGELLLIGDQVGRGYLRRPELTAERFVERDGRPAYRTGDLVRIEPDGVVHLHGRTDFQVKIRGHRIELGEIEGVIDLHPGVHDCVVTTVERLGEREIAAHVEASAEVRSAAGTTQDELGRLHGPASQSLAEDLRRLVAERLPSAMVPAHVAVLAAMPRTLNGKRDRSALPPLELDGFTTGAAPSSPSESLIAETVAEVLGRPTVAVDRSFGALGVDSLRAASVVSRLRRAGLVVPLREVTSSVTIRELAALPGAAQQAAEEVDPVPHDAAPAPLTSTQREFWLGEQLSGPESAQWTVPLHIAIDGAVDPAVLARALALMPQRHPALATAIGDDGEPRRVTPAEVDCEVLDLRHLDPEALEQRASAELGQRALRPLGLAHGELLRATLALGGRTSHLLLQVHHCAFDGLSTRPLLADLVAVHEAVRRGEELPQVPLPTSDDAARWSLAQDARDHGRRVSHWQSRLVATEPEQAAPGGRALAFAGPFAGGRVEVPVPTALREKVARNAAALEVTPYALALAALAVRSHRETGRRDVVLASAVNARRHPDLGDVVGLFLNMGLVRIHVDPQEAFGDLARRIAHQVAEDNRVGHLPWGEVLTLAGLTRPVEQPRSELLTLAMQGPAVAVHAADLTWRYEREFDNGGAKADATLFWEFENEHQPHVALEFAKERYSRADAERLLDQLLLIVHRAVEAPGVPVGELDWVSGDEHVALRSLSGSDVLKTVEGSVVSLILDQARQTPDALAVDCPVVGRVSYRNLVAGAAVVAAELPEGGTPVAVSARRGARTIAAMLGAWLAGRAYLPLDVDHPRARLEHALADSEVETLCIDCSSPRLAGPTTIIDLEHLLSSDGSSWEHPGALPREGGHTAYRIYTSGSTGRPKGVTVGHGALHGFIRAMGDLLPPRADEVTAWVTTPSFDISGLETWLPLTTGRCVRVVSEEDTRDGFALGRRLAGCTTVQMTPTGWQVLLGSGWSGSPGVRALVGGESVPPTLAGELATLASEAWNVYGPTEATIWATARRLAADLVDEVTTPIGRPLANTVVHVLDKGGRLVPPGVVGEIWIGGHGLAEGYQNLPDQTAERFVDLPWLANNVVPQRFYRTGDLGRWHDGELHCLGRTDGQIKLRGVRMEIGEIEAALAAQPGVEACAVGVLGEGTPDAALVGYVVGLDALDTAAIETRLLERLPSAYVPRTWVRLSELPLTGNGKIARNRLPVPDTAPTDGTGEPPRGELEVLVADVWGEVLGVADLSRTDHFMRRGGHSLLATRVVALLREDLDLVVPVRLLFEQPRLADFAQALGELLTADLAGSVGADDVVMPVVAP